MMIHAMTRTNHDNSKNAFLYKNLLKKKEDIQNSSYIVRDHKFIFF